MNDPISAELSMAGIIPFISTEPVQYKQIFDDSTIYSSVLSVYDKQSNQFMSDWLSNILIIVVKTSRITLKANTHKCVSTMVLLEAAV